MADAVEGITADDMVCMVPTVVHGHGIHVTKSIKNYQSLGKLKKQITIPDDLIMVRKTNSPIDPMSLARFIDCQYLALDLHLGACTPMFPRSASVIYMGITNVGIHDQWWSIIS